MDKTKYNSQDKETMVKLFGLVENVNSNVISVNKEITELKVNVAENNVILEQHHARSTHLEGIVDVVRESMNELTNKTVAINTNVKNIDNDLRPIKQHVKKVNRYITLVNGIPLVFKFIISLFVLTSSGYGFYSVIVKLLKG